MSVIKVACKIILCAVEVLGEAAMVEVLFSIIMRPFVVHSVEGRIADIIPEDNSK